MVAAMAYRDPEVGPVAHDPGAASLPAPPDWRRLYEQARERAEAAEARAEELKWAEVTARSAAGAWKSQFETARRKRLAAVEDANKARRTAKNALASGGRGASSEQPARGRGSGVGQVQRHGAAPGDRPAAQ